MKQESKQLVLKDLCGRLPYGVKVKTNNINVLSLGTHTRVGEYVTDINESCKPYLFPLSSMTKEQEKEFYKLFKEGMAEYANETKQWLRTNRANETKRPITIAYVMVHELVVDWLNKNNFDYRGLIEKGLALDATNLGIY